MANRTRRRRGLYTRGAMMVLAPIGVAACGGSAEQEAVVIAPKKDASADTSYPDALAIAPYDAAPEVIAVVPYDSGPDAMMIAPPDDSGPDGPMMIAPPPDAGPDAMMIAPPDDSGPDGPMMIAPPSDASYDGPMMIAPASDAKAEAGKGEKCQVDEDCLDTLFCEQMMCIFPCDPSCQEKVCDPKNPQCPAGSDCENVGGQDLCVRK